MKKKAVIILQMRGQRRSSVRSMHIKDFILAMRVKMSLLAGIQTLILDL